MLQWVQMGYWEIFQRQKFHVVEIEDACNFESTQMCKSFEGWEVDVDKPNPIIEDQDDW